MGKKIDISIIVPVYNVEKYLIECLNSILNQTFQYYEVITINDGSTDNSKDILINYSKKYERFFYYEHENIGLSATRNKGLELAVGKYVLFMDSDDSWNGDFLSQIFEIIESESLDLLVFSGSRNIYDCNDKLVKTELLDNISNKSVFYTKGIELFEWLKNRNLYKTGVYFYLVNRTILIENKIRFIEGIIHEDHYFTFMVYMNSLKSRYIPNNIYLYRVRNSSIMTTKKRYMERFVGFLMSYNFITDWCYSNKEKVGKFSQISVYVNNLFFLSFKYLLKSLFFETSKMSELCLFFCNVRKFQFMNFKNKLIYLLIAFFYIRK